MGTAALNKRRLELGALRRRLQAEDLAARQRVTLALDADDESLLRQALRGVTALRPSEQADLGKTPPPPLPRPRPAQPLERPEHSGSTGENWFPASWLAETSTPVLPTPEDTALAAALHGVVPLATDKVFPEAPKPRPLPRQRERDERAALAESIYAPTSLELRLEGGDELHYLSHGVARGVLRDLRRGRWVIQREIDLHGATRDEARDLLANFLGQCRKQGVRCVRVVHGKGRGSPGREPVLKRLVAGWLMNYEDVMAYCQARLPDGGAGALIVLLKAQRRDMRATL